MGIYWEGGGEGEGGVFYQNSSRVYVCSVANFMVHKEYIGSDKNRKTDESAYILLTKLK